jgi:hypothetical protein
MPLMRLPVHRSHCWRFHECHDRADRLPSSVRFGKDRAHRAEDCPCQARRCHQCPTPIRITMVTMIVRSGLRGFECCLLVNFHDQGITGIAQTNFCVGADHPIAVRSRISKRCRQGRLGTAGRSIRFPATARLIGVYRGGRWHGAPTESASSLRSASTRYALEPVPPGSHGCLQHLGDGAEKGAVVISRPRRSAAGSSKKA